MNMKFYRKLPIPMDVKAMYPVSEEMTAQKAKRDKEIADVFIGRSEKKLLVIGPCSADRKEPVLEYLERLKKVSDAVSDKIIIIPRLYTNKPRTTGDGYTGMLHYPDPESHPDMLLGIVSSRELHMTALRDYGFSSADEMLYPDNHRYFSDLLSYVAVGARSVENQQHRLTASGLDIPVGMKNPIGGDISVMLNAVSASRHPHTFIYRGWEVESTGNPLSHSILRGYQRDGKSFPNYGYDDLKNLLIEYGKAKLENPAVIVDTNHGNSGKDFNKQVEIAKDVLCSMGKDSDINRFCKGFMIESYIEDGSQEVSGTVFGKSITDPCLGWDKTEKLIFDIADKIK